ncbi:glycosyltransferase family 39 protein [Fontivita pretiosa]|uniref:glycosyltransferase family 39 protein n=1 Tax=Fontivita pretiosa TaxID=2989684 RepID=UPI003D16440B
MSPAKHRWIHPTIILVAIVVMVARIGSTWPIFNDTVDEPYHLGSGVALLEARRHVHGIQHPPLARLVAAIPLWLSGVRLPEPWRDSTIHADIDAFDVGDRLLMHGPWPYGTMLTRARAGMLLFAVLVVLYVYLLGRYIGSPLVGICSAVLVSTDPTLLGHGGLVGNDVAAAAGFLAALYHGTRFIARGNGRAAFAGGVAMGLGVACKFTAALAAPALGLLLLSRRGRALIRGRLAAYRRAWPGAGALAIFLVTAFLSLWATYFFDIGRLDDSASAVAGAASWERIPRFLRHLPLPMPSAILGLITLLEHNRAGHGAMYLNGQISTAGWWYYFPEAIVIKSPMSLSIGLLLAGTVALRRPRPRRIGVLLIPAMLFLLASMSSRVNIGVRHVLPVIPLLYLIIVHVLAGTRRRGIIVALMILALLETAWVHPDYLAFFNTLVGGPGNGDRYLLDSNLDWGQDQARARRWLAEHAKGRTVSLRVFGHPRLRQWPADGYQIVAAGEPARGLLLVSRNVFWGLYPCVYTDSQGRTRPEPDVSWALDRLRPVARIGFSIDVYDLEPDTKRSGR